MASYVRLGCVLVGVYVLSEAVIGVANGAEVREVEFKLISPRNLPSRPPPQRRTAFSHSLRPLGILCSLRLRIATAI